MPRIRTPWDRVAEVDRGGGPVVLPGVDNPHIPNHVVAPAPPDPGSQPRARFEARVLRNGKVELPLELLSPVMSLLGSWWREQPGLVPPGPSSPRSLGSSVVPLTDDTIVDQRIAPVPRDLYLRLARSGAFPSKRIGKRIVAKWADVRAAFEGTPRAHEQPDGKGNPASPDDGLDDLRREIGLVPKGG